MSSSDRSRTSDDRRHHYKAVVAQQGRVIIDRDWNALETIVNERADADVLAIVGPAGTPDDGFAISVPSASPPGLLFSPGSPPSFDFTIGPGTMYVGGQRTQFPATLGGSAQTYSYFSQPDWLRPNDPVPSSSPQLLRGASPASNSIEVVWLDVFDSEVSATEDPDLKEVALGGPDTTARVRLMRRVRRTPVPDSGCAAGWLDVTNMWSTDLGLIFDPEEMRLEPAVRLQVSFQQDPASTDACDPVAHGGFLYSENQLIRIQISEATAADGTGGRFLWGYDNASFLYRVSSVTNAGTQLQLADSPPDAFHWPKSGQVVEILRTAVVLGTAPDANNPAAMIVRCVAEPVGVLRTLSQSYGATTQGGTANYLTFTDPLPIEYLNDPNPLFVRIWQAEQDYTPGGVALLDGTNGTNNGVVVTLTTPLNVPMTVGAFWMIALRPGTPQAVYPERFLNSPQPPDGPARWACPLATIDWSTQPPTVTDCRSPFDNLVTLTKRKPGCCTVAVRPEDLTGTNTLKKIIDGAVARARSVTICFGPGIYLLRDALRLDSRHAGIVLEACTEGAVLSPHPSADPALFSDGLLVLTDSPGVTLSGLTFVSVDAPTAQLTERNLALLARILAIEVEGFLQVGRSEFERTPLSSDPEGVMAGALQGLTTLICVRAVSCSRLTIENCRFDAASPSAFDGTSNSLAVGLLAQGNCSDLVVRRCTFLGNTHRATPGLVAVPRETPVKGGRPVRGLQAGSALESALGPITDAAAAVVAAEEAAAAAAKKTPKKTAAKAASVTRAAAKKTAAARAVGPTETLLQQLPSLMDLTHFPRVADRQPVAMGAGCLIIPHLVSFKSQEQVVRLEFGLPTRLVDAELSGNAFSNLTLAAASVAGTGRVHVGDNSVRDCAAGVWIAPWQGSLFQLNPRKIVPVGADLLLLYALLCEETVLVLFAPMMLPLPAAAHPIGALPAPPNVALTFTGNDIDCTPAPSSPTAMGSSMALATFADRSSADTSVIVASNRLVGNLATAYPTVLLTLSGDLSITGNHIANKESSQVTRGKVSLVIDPNSRAATGGGAALELAVTGNVFHGVTNLESFPRPGNFAAPLDNWDTFNAVIA
jgi:Family of unknown function (DUF6519)